MTWQPENLPNYHRALHQARAKAFETGRDWYVVCLDDPPFGRICVPCDEAYLDDPEFEAFEGSIVEIVLIVGGFEE